MSKTKLAIRNLAPRYRFECPVIIPLKSADGRPIKPPFEPKPNRRGYPVFSVRMRKLGISMQIQVHQVVAYQKFGEAIFAPNTHVRHRDNNKLNFRQDNIILGTPKDNFEDNPEHVKEKIRNAARVAWHSWKVN